MRARALRDYPRSSCDGSLPGSGLETTPTLLVPTVPLSEIRRPLKRRSRAHEHDGQSSRHLYGALAHLLHPVSRRPHASLLLPNKPGCASWCCAVAASRAKTLSRSTSPNESEVDPTIVRWRPNGLDDAHENRPNRARALTATGSWFEHHRAVGAFGGVCQCFRGFCERIGGADVDAEPAVGE
jgi:hypothetical protein